MKDFIMGVVVVAIVAFVWVMTPSMASATDKLLEARIDSVTVTKDKNGADMVRMIVLENKEIDGVKYSKGVPVMAFRENVDAAKRLKAGDTLKAVVNHSTTSDGRESYRILTFATAAPKKK